MERHLLTFLIPSDEIPTRPGDSTDVDIGQRLADYQRWRLVSHTCQLVDGGALLSLILERP